MEVTCEHCGSKLNIPDEKIPAGRRVAVSCPKCRNKLTIETPSQPEKTATRPEETTPFASKRKPDDLELTEDEDGAPADDELDFYEEGVKPALILSSDPRQLDALKEAAEELDYRCMCPKNTRDAIGKLRYHHFDLVLVTDRFDGIELRQSPILQYINNLSMSTRRRMFIALVGDQLKTMDQMTAYALSANLVLNNKDQAKAETIMRHAISDNDKFYKVFKDCLAEVGKI